MPNVTDSFTSILDTSSSESSLLIHQNKVEICLDGNYHTGDADVRLDLLPHPSLYFYGHFNNLSPIDIIHIARNSSAISEFKINGTKIDGFQITSTHNLVTNQCTVKWCSYTSSIIGVGDESTSIDYLVFHLFNFKDFIGTRQTIVGGETWSKKINHIDITEDNYTIEIKSHAETDDNIKRIKNDGACLITHIGKIHKTDGTFLNGKEATDILKELGCFLSFANGERCNPICAIGFNSSGNRIWESWSTPEDAKHIPMCWFDPKHSSQLVSLFHGFHEKWKNIAWQDALEESVYWYLSANLPTRGIDAGIILTQAALERFSYEFSVIHKKLLTSHGFKEIWASDQFRLLFSSLNLPLHIPDEAQQLKQFGTSMKWLDAPHALTDIRNSIIHPDHKRRGQFNPAMFEAWKLGLWYLELSILAICNYKDTYSNRLKIQQIGSVEVVPWA